MPKKEHIHLVRTEEMTDVDAELESAMQRLDSTNQRIDQLLTDFEAHGTGIEVTDDFNDETGELENVNAKPRSTQPVVVAEVSAEDEEVYEEDEYDDDDDDDDEDDDDDDDSD